MQVPQVSILIPTFNGEGDLARLIPALDAQEFDGLVERLAIDSSSSDGSVQMLRKAGFSVEVIEQSSFGHGATRNALAAKARGEWLVFLSQDATPIGADFLARLVGAAKADGVAGVTARVLPRDSDDALTARTVLEAPEGSGSSDERRLRGGVGALAQMSGKERAEILRFNNVASCIRRSVMTALPFPEVPFGEDVAWAARALQAGWSLRHEPSAVVAHAHRYGPVTAYARYRSDAAFHREFHGHAVRSSLFSCLKGIAFELKSDLAYVRRTGSGWASLLRAPFLRTAQVMGQYAGSRGGRRAWAEARARGAFEPILPRP